jgi:hypothetical protein
MLYLLEVLIEGGDGLLIIAKTYSYRELTLASDSNSSKSSIDSSSSDHDPDSDLTDTSELAQSLAE